MQLRELREGQTMQEEAITCECTQGKDCFSNRSGQDDNTLLILNAGDPKRIKHQPQSEEPKDGSDNVCQVLHQQRSKMELLQTGIRGLLS